MTGFIANVTFLHHSGWWYFDRVTRYRRRCLHIILWVSSFSFLLSFLYQLCISFLNRAHQIPREHWRQPVKCECLKRIFAVPKIVREPKITWSQWLLPCIAITVLTLCQIYSAMTDGHDFFYLQLRPIWRPTLSNEQPFITTILSQSQFFFLPIYVA